VLTTCIIAVKIEKYAHTLKANKLFNVNITLDFC
jgi:hypothetical protein